MGLLDADKILTTAEMSSGGNRGQESRNKTLLSTDKLVNKLIVSFIFHNQAWQTIFIPIYILVTSIF